MSPDPSKPSETVDSSVFERLQARLAAACVAFNVLRHGPVTTSEEAALVRGTSLASGAKALLLMLDGRPELFVLPADRKLDSRKLRKSLSVRSLRFASVDEVVAITRLRPGAIPPFGSLFGLATYCDPAMAANPSINFNAGDHAVSISMPYADFVRVECPKMVEIT